MNGGVGSLFHMGQLFFFSQQEVQHPCQNLFRRSFIVFISLFVLPNRRSWIMKLMTQKGLLCLKWHQSCTKTARYHFFLLSGFLWAGALDLCRFFSERCFFCSKHGRFDTSESGIRNVARLVLQHGDGSEFRGASGAGSKLYSVHRGLPASARFVKRYFSLMGMETAANVFVRFAKTCQSNFGPCVFSFQWSGSESASPGRASSNCFDLSVFCFPRLLPAVLDTSSDDTLRFS